VKKILIPGLFVVAITVWFIWLTPAKPTRTIAAEVIALENVIGGRGLRRITVRFEDGREHTIETLAPFFFRPGYKATVAIYERLLFSDIYEIISGGNP